jgi:hypothetical protein
MHREVKVSGESATLNYSQLKISRGAYPTKVKSSSVHLSYAGVFLSLSLYYDEPDYYNKPTRRNV